MISKIKKQLPIAGEKIPYIGLPVNAVCPLNCVYCTPGGEANKVQKDISFDFLKEVTLAGLEVGVTKFRLTGGEPLLHPNLKNILEFFSRLPAQTTLNTSGFKVLKRKDVFSNLGPNLEVICSLDSLDEKTFNKISGTKKLYEPTLGGIKHLSNLGILKRLNMMVLKYNADELDSIIDYARELNCDLKIADTACVVEGFGNWEDYYMSISDIEKSLESRADEIIDHPYTKNFGIPSKKYLIDGVAVTVKSSANGSTYLLDGTCDECSAYPCEEGVYFMSVLSDGSISGCRLNKLYQESSKDLKQDFKSMIKKFENLTYVEVKK